MIQIGECVYAEKPLAADEGLQFGRGVFETILVLRRPLFWAEHCRRLNSGLAALAVRDPVDPESLLREIGLLKIRDCVLKILVTPENLVLLTRPAPAADPGRTWRLTARPDPRSGDPRLLANKTLNYLPALLAWQEARAGGYDDALFIGSQGMVRECSRSNIFIIRQNRILTPDLSCGLLPGIIRQWLLDTATAAAVCLDRDDLRTADAMFISNSVLGIGSVADLDGQPFPDHPLLAEIKDLYRKRVIEPGCRD